MAIASVFSRSLNKTNIMRINTYVFVFLWYLDFFCKIERSFYRKDKVIRSRRLCIARIMVFCFLSFYTENIEK